MALIAAAVVGVIGVTNDFLAPFSGSPGGALSSIAVQGTYVAELQIGSSHVGRIHEKLEIPMKELAGAVVRRSHGAAVLEQALIRQGWEQAVFSASPALDFTRTRRWKLQFSSLLPAQQTNRFPEPMISATLRPGKAGDDRSHEDLLSSERLIVYFDSASKVVLDAPENAIGHTFPEGRREAVPEVGEQISLPLPEPSEPTLRFQVRSSDFRRWPLVEALGLTEAKLFGVVLTVLGWLSSKRIRVRVRRWLRFAYAKRRAKPGSSEPVSEEAGEGG
jgi:hypothetical protein